MNTTSSKIYRKWFIVFIVIFLIIYWIYNSFSLELAFFSFVIIVLFFLYFYIIAINELLDKTSDFLRYIVEKENLSIPEWLDKSLNSQPSWIHALREYSKNSDSENIKMMENISKIIKK